MRHVVFLILLALIVSSQSYAQDLSPEDVTITLDEALPVALKEARNQFHDLDDYLLYSVSPRVLKGDRQKERDKPVKP